MPNPPLPPNASVVPGGGDLVVSSSADVLATLPDFVQRAQGAPAPVRDAIVSAQEAIQERYQEQSAYAAAQCDVLRATDQYLLGLGEDRGVYQQPAEAQEAFRARVVQPPAQVTPAAIVAAANTILAPLTSVQAEYFESGLDRFFITDGTAPFHSFLGPVSPTYLDRLYRDDAATNGTTVPNREPGGGWTFSDTIGRYLVLRVPVVADSDVALAYCGWTNLQGQNVSTPVTVYAQDARPPELGGAQAGGLELNGTLIVEPAQTGANLPTTAGGTGLWLGDGSNTSGAEADGSVATFLYTGVTTALATYQAIVNAVERIHGQSIRWMLYVDPALTT